MLSPSKRRQAMQIVAPSRFLDGAAPETPLEAPCRGVVFAVFLLFVSGGGLYMFGEFHKCGTRRIEARIDA